MSSWTAASIIRLLLNKQVGKWVDGLDNQNIQTDGLKGFVVENLSLKTDCLADYPMPFSVKSGTLKKLCVVWKTTTTALIEIDDLDICLGPAIETVNSVEKRQLASKRRKLEQWEKVLHSLRKENAGESDADTSYRMRILRGLLNSLEIVVKRINVTYEESACTFRLAIDEIRIQNEEQAAPVAGEKPRQLCKHFSVENIAVFIITKTHTDETETQEMQNYYVVRPLSANATLTIVSGSQQLEVSLPTFEIEVDKSQVAAISNLADDWAFRSRWNLPKRHRPESSRPSTAPADWWRFAIQSVVDKVRRTSPNYLAEWGIDRRLYQELYMKKTKLGVLSDLHDETLFEAIESRRSFQEIICYRCLALRSLAASGHTPAPTAAAESGAVTAASEAKEIPKKSWGWASYIPSGLFMGTKSKTLEEEVSFLDLTDEEQRELLTAFDVKDLGTTPEGAVDVAHTYSFWIGVARVRLYDGSGRTSVDMAASLYSADGSFRTVNKIFEMSVSLGGFEVADPLRERKLLRGGNTRVLERRLRADQPDEDSEEISTRIRPLLTVAVKSDWTEFPVQVSVAVNAGQMECVFDAGWWLTIFRYFSVSHENNGDVFRSATLEIVAEAQRLSTVSPLCRKFSIEMDIAAPNICFPDLVMDSTVSLTTSAVVVKLGNIKIRNNAESVAKLMSDLEQSGDGAERVANSVLIETSNVEVAFLSHLSCESLRLCEIPTVSSAANSSYARLLSNVHLRVTVAVSVPMYTSGGLVGDVQASLSRALLRLNPLQIKGISRVAGSLNWSLKRQTVVVPTKTAPAVQGRLIVQGSQSGGGWYWRWCELTNTDIVFLQNMDSKWPERAVSLGWYHCVVKEIGGSICMVLEHLRDRLDCIIMVLPMEEVSRTIWIDQIMHARAVAARDFNVEELSAAVALTHEGEASAECEADSGEGTSAGSKDEISRKVHSVRDIKLSLRTQDLLLVIFDESNGDSEVVLRGAVRDIGVVATHAQAKRASNNTFGLTVAGLQLDNGQDEGVLISVGWENSKGIVASSEKGCPKSLSLSLDWGTNNGKHPFFHVSLQKSLWCFRPQQLRLMSELGQTVRVGFGSASRGQQSVRVGAASLLSSSSTLISTTHSLAHAPASLQIGERDFYVVAEVSVDFGEVTVDLHKTITTESGSVVYAPLVSLSLGHGLKAHADLGPSGRVRARGSIGSLSLRDNTTAGRFYPLIIDMAASDTLGEFKFDTFDYLDLQYPGHDAKAVIHVNKIRMHLLYRYYSEVKGFIESITPTDVSLQDPSPRPTLTLSSSIEDPNLVDSDPAPSVVTRHRKYILEAHLSHPQLIIPRSSLSHDALVVDLGTIIVTNSFIPTHSAAFGLQRHLSQIAINFADVSIGTVVDQSALHSLSHMAQVTLTLQWESHKTFWGEISDDSAAIGDDELVPIVLDFFIPNLSGELSDEHYELIMGVVSENMSEYPLGVLSSLESSTSKWPEVNEINEIHEAAERRNLEQPAYMRVNVNIALLSLRLGFTDVETHDPIFKALVQVGINGLDLRMDLFDKLPDNSDALSWEMKLAMCAATVTDVRSRYSERTLPLLDVTSSHSNLTLNNFWKVTEKRGQDFIRRKRLANGPDKCAFIYGVITKTSSSHRKNDIFLGETMLVLDLYAMWDLFEFLLKGNQVSWAQPPTKFPTNFIDDLGDSEEDVVQYSPRVSGTLVANFAVQFAKMYLLADFRARPDVPLPGFLHQGFLSGRYVIASSVSTMWNFCLKNFQTFSGNFFLQDQKREGTRRELHKPCTFFLLNSWRDVAESNLVHIEWEFRLWEAFFQITYEDVILGYQVFQNVFGSPKVSDGSMELVATTAGGLEESEVSADRRDSFVEEVSIFSGGDSSMNSTLTRPGSEDLRPRRLRKETVAAERNTECSYRVSMNVVSIVFINDFQRRWIPLLTLELPFVTYDHVYKYPHYPSVDNSSYEYECKCALGVSWYMLGEGEWEKVLDSITLKIRGRLQSHATSVLVTVEELLEVQLALPVLLSMRDAYSSLSKDSRPHALFGSTTPLTVEGEDEETGQRSEYVPRAIRNMTGMVLECHLNGGKVVCELQPNEFRGFHAAEIPVALGSPLQISLFFGDVFEPIFTVIADLVADRIYRLRRRKVAIDENEDLNILCSLTVEEGCVVLTVSSAVILRNLTTSPIDVSIVTTRNTHHASVPKTTFQLLPNADASVPLPLVMSGQMYLKTSMHMWTPSCESLCLQDVVDGNARLSQIMDEEFEERLKTHVPAQTRLMASFRCQLRTMKKSGWVSGRLYICDTCFVHWSDSGSVSLLLTSGISAVEKCSSKSGDGEKKRVSIQCDSQIWTVRHLGENLEKAFRILLREAHRTFIRSMSTGAAGQSRVASSLQLLLGVKPIFVAPCTMDDQFGDHKGHVAASDKIIGFSSVDDLIQHVMPWNEVSTINITKGDVPTLCVKDSSGFPKLRLRSEVWEVESVLSMLLTLWHKTARRKLSSGSQSEFCLPADTTLPDPIDVSAAAASSNPQTEKTRSFRDTKKGVEAALSTFNDLARKKVVELTTTPSIDKSEVLKFFDLEAEEVICSFECRVSDSAAANSSTSKGTLLATPLLLVFLSTSKLLWKRYVWVDLSTLNLEPDGVIVATLRDGRKLRAGPETADSWQSREVFRQLSAVWIESHALESNNSSTDSSANPDAIVSSRASATGSLSDEGEERSAKGRGRKRFSSIESPASINAKSPHPSLDPATSPSHSTGAHTEFGLTEVMHEAEEDEVAVDTRMVPDKGVVLKLDCTLQSPSDAGKDGCVWVTEESVTFISLDRELYSVIMWTDVVDILKKNTKLVLPNAIFILARNESRSLLLSSNKWQRDKVFEALHNLSRSNAGGAASGPHAGPLLVHHSNMAATAKSLFTFDIGEDIICNELGTLSPTSESGHFICTSKRVCFWSHQSNGKWEVGWNRVVLVSSLGEKTTIEFKDGRKLESSFVGSIVAMHLSSIATAAMARVDEEYVEVESPSKIRDDDDDDDCTVESPLPLLTLYSTPNVVAPAVALAATPPQPQRPSGLQKISSRFSRFSRIVSDRLTGTSAAAEVAEQASRVTREITQVANERTDREATESRILRYFDMDPKTEILFCFPCHLESSNEDSGVNGHVAATKETLFFLSLDAVSRKRIEWSTVVGVTKRRKLLGHEIYIQYGKEGRSMVLTGKWKEGAVVEMMLAAQREAAPGVSKAGGVDGGTLANQPFGKGVRRPQCITSLPSNSSAPGLDGVAFRCCLTAAGLTNGKVWAKGDPVLLTFLPPLVFQNLLASTLEIQWGENKRDVKTGLAGPWIPVRSGEKLDVPADLRWSLWMRMRPAGTVSGFSSSVAGSAMFRVHRGSKEQVTKQLVIGTSHRLPVSVTVGTKTAGNIRVSVRADYWIVNGSGLTLDMICLDEPDSSPSLIPCSKQPIDLSLLGDPDSQALAFRSTFFHGDPASRDEYSDAQPPWSNSINPRSLLGRPKWVMTKSRLKRGAKASATVQVSVDGPGGLVQTIESEPSARYISVAVLPAEGEFWQTFCVTLGPPVLIENCLGEDVEVGQWVEAAGRHAEGNISAVAVGKVLPFVCMGHPAVCSLVFRRSESTRWSNPIAVGVLGDVWVECFSLGVVCLRVSAIPGSVTTLVKFSPATGKAPHRITNNSSTPAQYRQHIPAAHPSPSSDDLSVTRLLRGKASVSVAVENQHPWITVKSQEETDIIWPDACGAPILQVLSGEPPTLSIVDLRELQKPPDTKGIQHPAAVGTTINISLEGASVVLNICDTDVLPNSVPTPDIDVLTSRLPSNSLRRASSVSRRRASLNGSQSFADAISHLESSSYSISVEGIGVLLLGKKKSPGQSDGMKRHQLLYVSASDFKAHVNVGKNRKQMIMQASNVQVDDENPTARFPVLLRAFPIDPNKSARGAGGAAESSPCVSFFFRQKTDQVDPMYVERCELKVGPLEVCFDDGIVPRLMAVVSSMRGPKLRLNETHKHKHNDEHTPDSFSHLPKSTKIILGVSSASALSSSRLYLENFQIAHLQLDLVLFFNSHSDEHRPSFMAQMGQVSRLVMNVPLQVQFNAKLFSAEKVLRTYGEMNEMLRTHYTKEAMKQIGQFVRQAVKGMMTNWTKKFNPAESSARKVRKIKYQ